MEYALAQNDLVGPRKDRYQYFQQKRNIQCEFGLYALVSMLRYVLCRHRSYPRMPYELSELTIDLILLARHLLRPGKESRAT